MTARENAETADLTLEVERLRAWVETATGLLQRAEGMRELAGTDVGIRMSKLLCEGPAQESNALEVERLRGELEHSEEKLRLRQADYALEFKTRQSVTEQLAEATGLLRCVSPTVSDSLLDAIDAFLKRAPAQATTNALLCYEGDCAKMTGRARPCPIHDAPAQTAEPDNVPGETDRQSAVRWMRQCMSAEARLAAVREAYEREIASYKALIAEHGTDLQIDADCCMRDLERTVGSALLAPSQGEGGGGNG